MPIKPLPNGDSSANEPPEPLQLCGVIAVHSPEARLYFIRRGTIWMAEAACSGSDLFKDAHRRMGPSSLLMRFMSTQTRQPGGAVIMLAERGASSSLHESRPPQYIFRENKTRGTERVWVKQSSQVHHNTLQQGRSNCRWIRISLQPQSDKWESSR